MLPLSYNSNRLRAYLEREEGKRKFPYRCSEGILTIGIGRNLESKGLSEEEIQFLFANDCAEVEKDAQAAFPWLQDCDEVRTEAVLSMCFQLGIGGVKKFKNFLAAMQGKQYSEAAKHALQSRWAQQTPARAKRVAHAIEFGQWKEP